MVARGIAGTLGFGQQRLGLGHARLGLEVLGACHVARLVAARHVGGQGLGTGQLALRLRQVAAGALPAPPSLAHACGQFQLGGLGTALGRCEGGIAQGGFTGTLARQPQRQRHAHGGLTCALAAADTVGLGLQLQRGRLGRPGVGAVALGLRGLPAQLEGLGLGLALPRLGKQRGQVGRCRHGRCRGRLRHGGRCACCQCPGARPGKAPGKGPEK